MFVKTALEMTKLKTKAATTTHHKCASVHICHWQFPRVRRVRHTHRNPPSPSTTSRARHLNLGSEKLFSQPQGWGSFIWILSLWSDLTVPWSQQHWMCQLRQHNQGSKTQHRHQERVDISDPFPAPTAAPVAADKSIKQCLRSEEHDSAPAGPSYLSGWWPPRSCTWGAGSPSGRGCRPCAPGRSSGSLGETGQGGQGHGRALRVDPKLSEESWQTPCGSER